MSITRGQFLRSLGKSLPGLVASTGVATAAAAVIRRVAQAAPPDAPDTPGEQDGPVPYFKRGFAGSNRIALTFDDGPVLGVTEQILEVLCQHRLHATFFMIGEKVAAAPELARRVLAEGHELGHHTFTHRKLTELSDTEVELELGRTDTLFRDLLGTPAAWFRPPFGALRQDQAVRVRRHGMKVAFWSLDSEDWRGDSGSQTSRRILEHVEPGSVILCHEVQNTAEVLSETLTGLEGRWQIGPIGTLTAS